MQVEQRRVVSERSERYGQQGVAGAAAFHCAGVHLQRPTRRAIQRSAQAASEGGPELKPLE